MNNATIIIASIALALVVGLGNYLSKRRTACLNRLETVENLLCSVDSEEDEHEWLALSLYDEIEEANELAFDGFMHRRVNEVVRLWKRKFPGVLENWESICWMNMTNMKSNKKSNMKYSDYEKSIKLLLENGNK